MKKFLIILMMVAMASFLFVGCLGVTPDIPDEDEEEPEPVLPPSVTPVISEITDVGETSIIDLYSSAIQYMNETDVADGILVTGFAPKYSEVNVYIGGVVAGTGYAYGVNETFTVFVAKSNLGVDGAKTIYATAMGLGFAESVPSTTYAFILDTVAPEIEEVTAERDEAYYYHPLHNFITVTATFSEELVKATAEDAEDWNVNVASNFFDLTAELISSKVVEIGVNCGNTDLPVGTVIRVAYEDIGETLIEDLAGNPAVESIKYCYLELEE